MQVGEYELVNEGKYQRAFDACEGDEASILIEYDKLGGLITKDNERIAMGSFWDFKNKKPVANPDPQFDPKPLRPAVTEELTEGEEPTVKVTKKEKKVKIKK